MKKLCQRIDCRMMKLKIVCNSTLTHQGLTADFFFFFNLAFFDELAHSDLTVTPAESASQTVPISTVSLPNISIQPSEKRQKPFQVTAWLWNHFTVTTISRSWKSRAGKEHPTDREIKCNYCPWKTFDSVWQTSTGNMQRHMHIKHSISPSGTASSDISSPTTQQASIVGLFARQGAVTHEELFEKNILQWVIRHKQSFTTVESPEFQQIFNDLPGPSLPFTSRMTLKRRLEKEFEAQQSELKVELFSTCKTLALSLDVWTSQNHLPILGVIGHWLTENFEYREKTLEFCEVHGVHSGENLATAVHRILVELNLTSKLMTITGDNASNNNSMALELFKLLNDDISSQPDLNSDVSQTRPLFQGLDSYIRCLAHIMNLIVKDILMALKGGSVEEAHATCDEMYKGLMRTALLVLSPLAKLRILTVWIHRSPQRRQKWNEICRFAGLSEKFIEYDVGTRWNSTYRMLDDGLKGQRQIDKFLDYQSDILPFTENEWKWLEQLHNVLQKFNDFSLFVQEKQPQISLTVPLYYDLHDLLHDGSERKSEFAGLSEDIAAAIGEGLKKYKKYYTHMDASDIYYTASILDPRVKGELICEELEDKVAATNILNNIRTSLHQKYPSVDWNKTLTTSQSSAPSQSTVGQRLMKRLGSGAVSSGSDIDKYFDSPRLNVNSVSIEDPSWLFNWWRAHKDEFPRMAAVARDFLAIPSSEAGVERLFSKGRDLLGVRRYSMNGETMKMMMLLDSA